MVRDLHDGAQQRLVHTVVTLKLARRAVRDKDGKAGSLLSEALEHAEQGNRELRDLAHGILPPPLTHGGLQPASCGGDTGRPACSGRRPGRPASGQSIEASAYFVVAEALTNVVKHSHAGAAKVTASLQDGTLHVEVRDNGTGGANPDGHGLVGMRDRVTTLGGRLEIESSAGDGTRAAATLPLSAASTSSFHRRPSEPLDRGHRRDRAHQHPRSEQRCSDLKEATDRGVVDSSDTLR